MAPPPNKLTEWLKDRTLLAKHYLLKTDDQIKTNIKNMILDYNTRIIHAWAHIAKPPPFDIDAA